MNMNVGSDSLLEKKYLIGIVMVIVNIGARFIVNELDDSQKSFVNSKILRYIINILCNFLATRYCNFNNFINSRYIFYF